MHTLLRKEHTMKFHLLVLILALPVLAHISFSPGSTHKVGPLQYLLHTFYARIEPVFLRIADLVITKRIVSGTRIGRLALRIMSLAFRALPHGIIMTTATAERFVERIESLDPDGSVRFAVGPCVCQKSLDRWKEPSCKDITILYGADIYLRLDLGYRVITLAETKSILRQCRDAGLVHTLDFCMQSGRWNFVICNCDADICVLSRTYLITGAFLYPGPETVSVQGDRCRGKDACGACLGSCMFGAIADTGDKPRTDPARCVGCGQCAFRCTGAARSMVERGGYRHDHILSRDLITPDR